MVTTSSTTSTVSPVRGLDGPETPGRPGGRHVTCPSAARREPGTTAAGREHRAAGDRLGDRLGLVVAAPAGAPRAGGRPGDDIDVPEPQPAHHLFGEHRRLRPGGAGTSRPATRSLGSPSKENAARMPDGLSAPRPAGGQRETAAVTERLSRPEPRMPAHCLEARRTWCNQYQEGVTEPSVGSRRDAHRARRSTGASDSPVASSGWVASASGSACSSRPTSALAPWDVFHQGVAVTPA